MGKGRKVGRGEDGGRQRAVLKEKEKQLLLRN